MRDEQAAVRAESGEKKTVSLACSFAQAPRCGILAFSAENLGEVGELYAAAYTSEQPPRRPVKIGIGICTYRRENAALRGGHDNNKREGLVFGGRGLRVFLPVFR